MIIQKNMDAFQMLDIAITAKWLHIDLYDSSLPSAKKLIKFLICNDIGFKNSLQTHCSK